MMEIISFQLSVLIAVLSVVYTNILTRPGQIFGSVYKRLNTFFKTDERNRNGKNVHPIFMMIMYCEKCFAGQVALWTYIYYHIHDYNFMQHVLFVASTIYFAHTIKELNQKIEN